MTDLSCTHPTAHQPRRSVLSRLLTWRAVAIQRRQLAQLSPEQLCDIGVNASQAATEAARPAWDVPSHWRS